MITEICGEIRNWFTQPEDIRYGTFTISGGKIAPLDYLIDGQYFRVVGSVLNDGVYVYGEEELVDETFTGAIWPMKVPTDFVKLSGEIQQFCESAQGKVTPYTSESFDGYSYSKATDANGAPMGWQSVFAKRLNKYRKVFPL